MTDSAHIASSNDEDTTVWYIEKFIANPHYYDYIHTFTLLSKNEHDDYGKIKMCAGGGQSIDFVAEGEFRLDFLNDNEGVLIIKNLYENFKLDDYEVKFKREYGNYILGPTWGFNDHLREEMLVIESRWVFERDPLIPGQNARENNLMYVLGDMPNKLSETIYYTDYETFSRKKLQQQGLPLSNDNFYSHSISFNRPVKETNLFDEHLALSSSNLLRDIIENLTKISHNKGRGIVSYYHNNGVLAAFCIFTSYPISAIIPDCDEIFIFNYFFSEEIAFPDELNNRIVDNIKHLLNEGNCVAFPPTTLLSFDELNIQKSMFSPEKSDEYRKIILDDFPSLDLGNHTIFFPPPFD